MTIALHIGDCRAVLATLPDASVHCVVTSPPYWGLRDYGVDGQLGLEPDFNAYVANMVGGVPRGAPGAARRRHAVAQSGG